MPEPDILVLVGVAIGVLPCIPSRMHISRIQPKYLRKINSIIGSLNHRPLQFHSSNSPVRIRHKPDLTNIGNSIIAKINTNIAFSIGRCVQGVEGVIGDVVGVGGVSVWGAGYLGDLGEVVEGLGCCGY